jgi:hypothetical protein
LVDFTTLRVVEVGCVTLRVTVGRVTLRVTVGRETLRVTVGRETLRTTGALRTGAARTTFGFFCCAVRRLVPPAAFDAAVVCANARGDVCTAAATAKAAIKMMNLRMCAPFSFFVFRRTRCASANGKTSWMHLSVYTDFIL